MKPFRLARQPQLYVDQAVCPGVCAALSARGATRVLVLTGGRSVRSRPVWNELLDELLRADVTFIDGTVRGEPSPRDVDALAEHTRIELGTCDAVVAIGGGSVLDAGKAVAAALGWMQANGANATAGADGAGDADGADDANGAVSTYPGIATWLEGVGSSEPPGVTLPLIAVPTTAGTGSEATKNAVLSELGSGGFKKSLRHENYIPAVALLDPSLAVGCPVEVTRASGLDAITQLLESHVSTAANAITDSLALTGLGLAGRAFPRLMAGEDTVALRRDMALAAYLSGVCLANAGLGVVHGIAGPLGAQREIPHGVACGLLVGPATHQAVRYLAGQDAPVNDDHDALGRYAAAADALGCGGSGETVARASRMADWLTEAAQPLGRLAAWGFTAPELKDVISASGGKNDPVPRGPAEIGALIAEIS